MVLVLPVQLVCIYPLWAINTNSNNNSSSNSSSNSSNNNNSRAKFPIDRHQFRCYNPNQLGCVWSQRNLTLTSVVTSQSLLKVSAKGAPSLNGVDLLRALPTQRPTWRVVSVLAAWKSPALINTTAPWKNRNEIAKQMCSETSWICTSKRIRSVLLLPLQLLQRQQRQQQPLPGMNVLSANVKWALTTPLVKMGPKPGAHHTAVCPPLSHK